jgi:hypothetical protein
MISKKVYNYIWWNHQDLVSSTTDVHQVEENKWQEMKLKKQNLVI